MAVQYVEGELMSQFIQRWKRENAIYTPKVPKNRTEIPRLPLNPN